MLWCYGTWQKCYETNLSDDVDVNYAEGVPDEGSLETYSADVIVLDDLMFDVAKNENASKLFTIYSHHKGMSVIFLTQNLTFRGRGIIEINRNTMYLVLFRNPRDSSFLSTVASQVMKDNKRHFREVFADATSEPFGYLVIDCHPTTPREFLLKSNVLPEDGRTQANIYFENSADIQKFKTLFSST